MPNRQEVVQDIRKTVGGAICDPEDLLKTVLDDNDFVTVGKLDIFIVIINYTYDNRIVKLYLFFVFCTVLETDRPDPNLSQADIKYVPEQM